MIARVSPAVGASAEEASVSRRCVAAVTHIARVRAGTESGVLLRVPRKAARQSVGEAPAGGPVPPPR